MITSDQMGFQAKPMTPATKPRLQRVNPEKNERAGQLAWFATWSHEIRVWPKQFPVRPKTGGVMQGQAEDERAWMRGGFEKGHSVPRVIRLIYES
jgi:hypothetical protein